MAVIIATKYINVLIAVYLAIRLWRLHLLSKYRVFVLFLLYDLTISVSVVLFPGHVLYDKYHIDYRYVWLVQRPLFWILCVSVVYAIVHRLTQEHPGIQRLSRRILITCFTIAIAVAVVSAQLEMSVVNRTPMPVLAGFVTRAIVLERAFLMTSLVLLGTSLLCLLWFPIRVTRNSAVMCAGLLIYFGSATGILLLRGVWAFATAKVVSSFLLLLHTACLLMWVRWITADGETQEVRPSDRWKPEHPDRIAKQLDALNKALTASDGKTEHQETRRSTKFEKILP